MLETEQKTPNPDASNPFKEKKSETQLSAVDSLAVELYLAGMAVRGYSQNWVQDPYAFKEYRDLVGAIKSGDQKRPAVDERTRAFSEFESHITGAENLPQDRGFVIASNHVTNGRMRGMWQPAAIFNAAAQNLPENPDRRYRVVVDREKTSLDASRAKLAKLAEFLPAQVSDKLLHTADLTIEQIYRHVEKVLANMTTTIDGIPVGTGGREILKTLKSDDVLGIFPVPASFALKRAMPEAGKLFALAGRFGTPVVPSASWFAPRHEKYVVKFGQPLTFKKTDMLTDQERADVVCQKIAELLPAQLRGYYQTKTDGER